MVAFSSLQKLTKKKHFANIINIFGFFVSLKQYGLVLVSMGQWVFA